MSMKNLNRVEDSLYASVWMDEAPIYLVLYLSSRDIHFCLDVLLCLEAFDLDMKEIFLWLLIRLL